MATFGNPIVASPNLLPSTAEVFNASKSGGYGAGEYVYHEGKLYKFTDAHTGAWTGSDVEEVKLADEVSDVAAELSSFEENVGENYARIDGYYDELTAGNAEQLIATVGVDNNTPYLFRTTGGSADVGDRKTMELVGGTIGWNQLARFEANIIPTNRNEITFSYTDGKSFKTSGTASGSCTAAGWFGLSELDGFKGKDGHKFIFIPKIISGSYTGSYYYYMPMYSARNIDVPTICIMPSGSGQKRLTLTITDGTVVNDLIVTFICIDLTQMFGSTIADYIYTLETANAGDGVAWFRKLFPKDYYAYNAGELLSVKTSANVTVGFNQWDEEWEVGSYDQTTGAKVANTSVIRSKNKIKVIPGAQYCLHNGAATSTYAYWYDANDGYLSYNTYSNDGIATVPTNAAYMTFRMNSAYGTTYNNDICINLSWDGERDGEYEPYDAHTYPLDSNLELRGIPKLDADNALYYDGDTYTSNGTVTRKFKLLNLGAQTWGVTNGHCFYTYVVADAKPPANNNSKPNILCPKYTTGTASQAYGGTQGNCISIGVDGVVGAGRVVVYDSNYSDATTFAGTMSGIYLLYELKTSTTEEADPFTSPETVDDFGTEQYVDTRTVPIPVGHNSVYQANLRAKLEMAPDSPDGDGDYLVRQSNGTNAYVPYIVPTAGDVNFDETAEYDDGTVGAELNNKANADGYYETLTVGQAEQLISNVGVDDSAPYNFRTTGGSADVGDRKTMELVGGTIAWNQLIQNGNFADGTTEWEPYATSSITYGSISASGDELTVTILEVGNDNYRNTATTRRARIADHIYLQSYDIYVDKTCEATNTYVEGASRVTINAGWTRLCGIAKAETSNASIKIYFGIARASSNGFSVNDTYKIKNVCLFDLTQMFGSTIADYIYTLEQATAGAGVAWFRKLFPNPYYAYNAGTLMSVKTSANVTTGFNQWDEEWEAGGFDTNGVKAADGSRIRSKNYVPVVPNTVYSVTRPAKTFRILFYDSNKNYISDYSVTSTNLFTTPNDCGYMMFTVGSSTSQQTTYDHDICINLSWDGERNGEYEPYVSHEYALDPDLELRGFPMLDADNALYYDGDTYESDGTVTRKYGIVDLGELSWSRSTTTGETPVNYFKADLDNAPFVSAGSSVRIKLISVKYAPTSTLTTALATTLAVDKTMVLSAAVTPVGIRIRDDSYETYSDFATAMSGVYLVYELAESTNESADPFTTPQIVDDFGTEEFVDAGVTADLPTRDVAIPVGHNSRYQPNLKAKLEMAPNSPDGDGDYIVRQVSGINTYVPITFPADELPAAPTTDGEFTLKCTVSDGVATFTWVSVS